MTKSDQLEDEGEHASVLTQFAFIPVQCLMANEQKRRHAFYVPLPSTRCGNVIETLAVSISPLYPRTRNMANLRNLPKARRLFVHLGVNTMCLNDVASFTELISDMSQEAVVLSLTLKNDNDTKNLNAVLGNLAQKENLNIVGAMVHVDVNPYANPPIDQNRLLAETGKLKVKQFTYDRLTDELPALRKWLHQWFSFPYEEDILRWFVEARGART
jgi:hypothetical protein